jgi:pimeloyl-ACP methyl ester carboxylesterase
VNVPSLVVVGRHDLVVRNAFARELAETLGGRCVTLDRGAHAVVFDAPEEFNREVASFLRSAVVPPPVE